MVTTTGLLGVDQSGWRKIFLFKLLNIWLLDDDDESYFHVFDLLALCFPLRLTSASVAGVLAKERTIARFQLREGWVYPSIDMVDVNRLTELLIECQVVQPDSP